MKIMNLKKRVETLKNEMNKPIIEYVLKWDERKNVNEWNDEDLKLYIEKSDDERWLFWPDEIDILARLKENVNNES